MGRIGGISRRPTARPEDMSGDVRKIRKEKDVLLSTFIVWPVAVIFTYLIPLDMNLLLRGVITFFLLYSIFFVNKKIEG